MILRNWLGYKLREQILLFERRAYHQSRTPPIEIFKAKYNQAIAREVKDLLYIGFAMKATCVNSTKSSLLGALYVKKREAESTASNRFSID